MDQNLRRRFAETVGTGAEVQLQEDTGQATGDQCMKKGHELFHQAEQEGFSNTATLVSSLQQFMQAAENGVDEATQWIGSFLGSLSALPPSVVLPEHMVRIMRWVTEATSTDKQIYIIAKSMFREMADGKASIPKDKIEEAATRLMTSQSGGTETPDLVKSSKMLRGSIRRLLQEAALSTTTDEITEDQFAEMAIKCSKGIFQAPSFFMADNLSNEQLEDFKQANIFRKVLDYPWQTFGYIKMYVLKQIEQRGIKWIWSSFPTKQFYLLLIAYLLPLLTINFVVSTIATVLFYAAFVAMIFATLQIILTSEKSFLMVEYSTIFQYFNKSSTKIEIKTPKDFIQHAVGPYIGFLVALSIATVTIGMSHQWMVLPELLSIVSSVFVAGLFLEFDLFKSPLTLVIILSRLSTGIYMVLEILQSYIPIPELIFLPSKSLFSFSWLDMNLISILQLPIQLGIMIFMIYRYSWRNMVTGLGPIMLFLCWSVLCRNLLYLSTARYLVMATGGVLVTVSAVPFIPLIFIFSPVFFFFYYGASRPFFISLSVVMVISLLLLFVVVNFQWIKQTKWLNIRLDYILSFQILLSIMFIVVGASLYSSMYEPDSLPVVTPQEYMNTCIPDTNGNANSVQTEINCYHLKDRVFEADGIIVEVRIQSIIDNSELSLKSLPSPIQTALTCLFGNAKPMCGDKQDNPTCVYAGCNFHHSLQYTFDIELRLNLTNKTSYHSLPATLLADTSFLDTVVKLQSGTFMRFNATFVNGMGSTHVTLQAQSLVPYDKSGINAVNSHRKEQEKFLFSRFVYSLKKTVYIWLEILFGYSVPIDDQD